MLNFSNLWLTSYKGASSDYFDCRLICRLLSRLISELFGVLNHLTQFPRAQGHFLKVLVSSNWPVHHPNVLLLYTTTQAIQSILYLAGAGVRKCLAWLLKKCILINYCEYLLIDFLSSNHLFQLQPIMYTLITFATYDINTLVVIQSFRSDTWGTLENKKTEPKTSVSKWIVIDLKTKNSILVEIITNGHYTP